MLWNTSQAVWLYLPVVCSRWGWLGEAVEDLQEPAVHLGDQPVCDGRRHQRLPGLQAAELPELPAAVSDGHHRVFHRGGRKGRAAARLPHRGAGLQQDGAPRAESGCPAAPAPPRLQRGVCWQSDLQQQAGGAACWPPPLASLKKKKISEEYVEFANGDVDCSVFLFCF